MWSRMNNAGQKIRAEIRVYALLRQHPRTPKLAKMLLGLAVAYAISPIDLIPDFIPVIGHLDDLLVIPALIYAALLLIPSELVAECRAQSGDQTGAS